MTRPTSDAFGVVAGLSGHALDAVRLESSAAASDAAWDGLAAVRAVPLSLIDAIEPGHAVTRLSTRRNRP
jgi:hypothetical protein